jgi:hypothetical protein
LFIDRFILAVAIIRALEIFGTELDRLIEQMEVERSSCRTRTNRQEIRDGAIQGVSASLILEMMEPLMQEGSKYLDGFNCQNVLNAVNTI